MRQEEKNNKKTILEVILALVLSFFIFATIWDVYHLQGTARIVNYAGIVRGATQRTIKLEVTNTPSDELIAKLDGILVELQDGGAVNNLTKIDDEKYQTCVTELRAYWDKLKEEIYLVREKGYDNTDIIEMSETYFILADNTVSAAEEYSQYIASRLQVFEYGMAIAAIVLLSILLQTTLEQVALKQKNQELESTAYIDVQTGLFNKSRCEELINAPQVLDDKTALLMYDMNNLKKINDSLGHVAGDSMIENFARILRLAVPEDGFVGRFGGDEFTVILHDCTEEDLNRVIGRVNTLMQEYNESSETIQLSYAYGAAHSSKYEGVTMKSLLEKADYEMYIDKMNSKKNG